MPPVAVNSQGAVASSQGDGAPLLELKGISKKFSGALALDDVNFSVRSGEVHVLFGENGAGKSTLISVIAGALSPDSGQIFFRGKLADIHSVHQARRLGISAVFQEFSLVPQLTIEENLFLGAEETRLGILRKVVTRRRAAEILDRLGFSLRPSQRVAHLSRAEQQMVEIAKAFRSELSILILDEPTASLTDRETEQLFRLIEKARARGVAIIYISHRINELRRIGDRITVLRDGKFVATVDAATPETKLVRLMTGRVIEQIFPPIEFKPGRRILEAQNITTSDANVRDLSLHVAEGEIVGLAGLVGSGKSEAVRAVFGVGTIANGSVTYRGEVTTGFSPRAMLDRGLFYLTSDRRGEGLLMIRSARENMSLAALPTRQFSLGFILKRRAEASRANSLAKRLNLQPGNIERLAEHFSGGNQQKILLAKCLTREVRLFIFDEPTVGVDVGTRVAIYEFIKELCEKGAAILLVSSDLPEILHLTNRVYVMCRGSVSAELEEDAIREETVLHHCFERKAA